MLKLSTQRHAESITSEQVDMHGAFGGHRDIRPSTNFMQRKDIERVVPAECKRFSVQLN